MDKFPIHGVLPPMITPFKEDGAVDYEAFASNDLQKSATSAATNL